MIRRFEPVLAAFFLAAWVVSLLSLFRVVDLAGSFSAGLYPLFGLAAACGWLFGNLYVVRARDLPAWLRRGLLLIYFVGPMSFLLLVRLMAPLRQQASAPFAAFYSWAVFGVLFLVPVMMKRSSVRPPGVRRGGRDR